MVHRRLVCHHSISSCGYGWSTYLPHVVFETAFGLVSPLEIHLDTAVVRLADIGVGVAGISHIDRHRAASSMSFRCLVIILEAEDHAGVKEACVKTDIQRFRGLPFNIRIAQSAHGNTLIQGLILSRSNKAPYCVLNDSKLRST